MTDKSETVDLLNKQYDRIIEFKHADANKYIQYVLMSKISSEFKLQSNDMIDEQYVHLISEDDRCHIESDHHKTMDCKDIKTKLEHVIYVPNKYFEQVKTIMYKTKYKNKASTIICPNSNPNSHTLSIFINCLTLKF